MAKALIKLFLLLLISIESYGQIKEIAKKGISSTVAIIALDENNEPIKYGSGFVFEKEKVATNFHVIERCSSILVLTNIDTIHYRCNEILNIDRINDIAIFKISLLPVPPLTISGDSIFEIGDLLYVVGNPKGLQGTFSEGIISAIRKLDNRKLLQITAPISHGSSGGPVLNAKGDVIGISVSTLAEGQNLNFAVPVEYLLELKDQKPTQLLLSKIESKDEVQSKEENKFEYKDFESAKDFYNKGLATENSISYSEVQQREAEGLPMEEKVKEGYEKAKFYYTKALEVEPCYYECYISRGLLKKELKDFDGAFEDYSNALKCSSNDIDKQIECLSWIKGSPLNKYDVAIKILDSLIRRKPDVKYYECRADYKQDIDDYPGALNDYLIVYEKNKFNVTDVLWSIAYCQSRLGNNLEAINNYTKYIAHEELDGYPRNLKSSYLQRANCKMELEDFRGALIDYKKAFSIAQKEKKPWEGDASFTELYNNIARAKIALNDYVGALADLNKAIEIYKGTGHTLSVSLNGKFEIDPDKADTYYFRGIAKIHLKNKEGACNDWSLAGQYGATSAYDRIKEYCK